VGASKVADIDDENRPDPIEPLCLTRKHPSGASEVWDVASGDRLVPFVLTNMEQFHIM